MTLTEEKINKNYLLWIEQLKKYNCYSEELIEDYGDKIKIASFSLNDISGSAYQGSLLDVVLYNLCAIANHINEKAFGMNNKGKVQHNHLYVNKSNLFKVLLLQHISKSEMFVPVTEQWKINKGIFYEFNPNLMTSMKLGERSLFICSTYGIQFTEEEYAAMKILDKDEDKTNSFITPLEQLVKISNQLTAIETYQRNKNQNN